MFLQTLVCPARRWGPGAQGRVVFSPAPPPSPWPPRPGAPPPSSGASPMYVCVYRYMCVFIFVCQCRASHSESLSAPGGAV